LGGRPDDEKQGHRQHHHGGNAAEEGRAAAAALTLAAFYFGQELLHRGCQPVEQTVSVLLPCRLVLFQKIFFHVVQIYNDY